MKLTPDDDIYRVRMLYFGSPGWTLPWQWTYGRWGLWAALSAAAVSGVLLVTGDWHVAVVAEVLATFASNFIWRYVDPDRPASKVIRTVLTDWHRHRQPGPGPACVSSLSGTHITVREHPCDPA